ncbi:ribosome-associated translation inhibitor RaiA [Paenibacillus sp. N1-5-1-14]|uniref:ribosome hibernation-promoting factor, HPF/YfiA family n=1 Tax=Paenibacillus radicibacter TaxID=2972488 RepID=UPI00215974A2|nr:ribosome-associated translation inhibitor RaiA [Paenibacillus radicibacter]MCR8645032.1 ribosome-associated translation inhibitor RaiA [Paenibacillus radicibacter]
MKFNIRGEHLEVTTALRDYVEKKLSRLERYFEAPLTNEVNVTMNVVKGMHIVEVTIPLQGVILRAEVKHSDMYASIDLVVDKLERQIRKHKTKTNRIIRSEGGKRDLFKMEVSPNSYEEEDELEVVRTKQFDFKPMDIEEAILQMNLIGHNFFVFSNTDSQQVSVVYRRDDGKYGLIEPAVR